MKNQKSLYTLFCLTLAILVLPCYAQKAEVRPELIKFARSIGFKKQLQAGVHISRDKNDWS